MQNKIIKTADRDGFHFQEQFCLDNPQSEIETRYVRIHSIQLLNLRFHVHEQMLVVPLWL
jgi:hypothetical protein